MSENNDTKIKINEIEWFTVGVTLLIWSLACAIIVGNSILPTNQGMMGMVGDAWIFLIIFYTTRSFYGD